MQERPEKVVSGMAQGVDTFAFDIAVDLGIPVVAAVPWVGHGAGWPAKEVNEYLARLGRAVEVHVTSDRQSYHVSVYPIRNRWMVTNSDLLVAVWDGVREGGTWDAMQFSRSLRREPRLLKWRSK